MRDVDQTIEVPIAAADRAAAAYRIAAAGGLTALTRFRASTRDSPGLHDLRRAPFAPDRVASASAAAGADAAHGVAPAAPAFALFASRCTVIADEAPASNRRTSSDKLRAPARAVPRLARATAYERTRPHYHHELHHHVVTVPSAVSGPRPRSTGS